MDTCMPYTTFVLQLVQAITQLHVEIWYTLKLTRKKKLGFQPEKLCHPVHAMAAKSHQSRHKGGCVTMRISLEESVATSSSRSLGLDWIHLTMKPPFNGTISHHTERDLTAERVVPLSFPFFPLPRSLVHWVAVRWPGSTCWNTGKLINGSWLDHYTAALPWEGAKGRQHMFGISCWSAVAALRLSSRLNHSLEKQKWAQVFSAQVDSCSKMFYRFTSSLSTQSQCISWIEVASLF